MIGHPSQKQTLTLAEDRWSHLRGIPTVSAWSLLLSPTKSHNGEMEQLETAALLVEDFSLQFLSFEMMYTVMVTPTFRYQLQLISAGYIR